MIFTGSVRMYFIPIIMIFFFCFSLSAENLVDNSSFELGSSGFSCERKMFLKTNPKYSYVAPEYDAQTKMHGKQSLKLRNPYSDIIELTSMDFKVEPDKDYAFSFWMKSEIDDVNVTAGVKSVQNSHWKMNTYGFKTRKAWKRYYLTFRTPSKGHDYFHVFIKIPRNVPVIWLDGIQVSPGNKLGAYTPKADIEAAIKFNQFYYFKNTGKPLAGEIAAVNYKNVPQKIKGYLRLYNDYSGKLIKSEEIELDIPGKSVALKNFECKVKEYLPYRAEIDCGIVKGLLPAYTVLLRNIEKKLLNLDETACVGINSKEGIKRLYKGKWKQPDRVYCGKMGQNELMKLYAVQGIRWLRLWAYTAFNWSFIEPQKGKFNWEAEDRAVDIAEKNGFRIMPILGGWSFSDVFVTARKKYCAKFLPDWVVEKAEILPANNPSHAAKGFKVYLPDIGDWRDYIRAIAERYKGRISHYEIMNEPNLYLTPEQYVRYLKVAYETCKQADPACKIVGICITSDFCGKPIDFLKGCFELGALKYMDILSFHPYGSALEESKISAPKRIAEIKELLKKYNNPDFPVWNDEMFFLYSGDEVIRRFLIDLGSGISQSSSLNCVSGNIVNPKSAYANAKYILPDSIFLANNTLTSFFEGAKSLNFSWEKPVTCYLFERNGEITAAVWNYNPIFNFSIRFAKGSRPVKIYDLFGNELPDTDKNIVETRLSKSPVYIKCPGLSAEEFADFMRKVQIISDTPAAIMGTRLKTGTHPELLVELKNTTTQRVNGVIKQKACPKWLSFDSEEVPFDLQPMASSLVHIPVKIKSSATGQTGKIDINVIAENKENLYSAKIFNAPFMTATQVNLGEIKTDGKLEEKPWRACAQAEAGTEIDTKTFLYENWSGAKDCSGIFKACHDDENLYISAQINDDIAGDRDNIASLWTGDALEIFIDTKPFKNLDKLDSYTDSTYQIVFASPSQKYPAPKHNVRGKIIKNSDIQWSYEKNTNGYIIELAIPLKCLGIANQEKRTIAIDFAVDDADSQNFRDTQIIWSGTRINYRDRSKFGYLFF